MFGVSTCWRSRSIDDGGRLAREVAGLGVKAFEIDYRVTETTLKSLLKTCRELNIEPLSIHAVCPAPGDKENRQVAEAYKLCDGNEEARLRAVEDVVGAIRLAADIGARAVVVHAGEVPMEKVTYELHRRFDEGTIETGEGRKFVGELKTERLWQRGNTFDQLLKSLDELNKVAESLNVDVGLENRYYFREYPNFEEMAIIFLRMSGSRIKYWHDTGHAQVQENLGITPSDYWLKEFGDDLAGIHIHDVDGYMDHYPPPRGGRGSVNFKSLKRYLKPDTIAILELRGDITCEQAQKGVDWLKSEGIA